MASIAMLSPAHAQRPTTESPKACRRELRQQILISFHNLGSEVPNEKTVSLIVDLVDYVSKRADQDKIILDPYGFRKGGVHPEKLSPQWARVLLRTIKTKFPDRKIDRCDRHIYYLVKS
jgi:hypothetical protein